MVGLSILIPVYNTDVTELVRDLYAQASSLPCPFEIILADDCSNPDYITINKPLAELDGVRYEQMPQNVGRAIIRNRLANFAQYDYLVFMDCDVAMVDSSYLKRYFSQANSCKVVFGGYTYKPEQKKHDCLLRWTYDTKLRTLSAEQRRLNPYSSFSTVNFMVLRSVMLAYPFNDRLSAYGHEDSMFRSEIEEQKIEITHIDNPVYHMHLDENNAFIEKTKRAVQNMLVIDTMPECAKLTRNLNLLRYYAKLKRWHLSSLVRAFFSVFEKPLLFNLKSSHPCLTLFQLYKLGYLCSIAK